jgi:hypothetical protein
VYPSSYVVAYLDFQLSCHKYLQNSQRYTHTCGLFFLIHFGLFSSEACNPLCNKKGGGGWGKTKGVVVHFVGWLIEYLTDEKKLLCNAHLWKHNPKVGNTNWQIRSIHWFVGHPSLRLKTEKPSSPHLGPLVSIPTPEHFTQSIRKRFAIHEKGYNLWILGIGIHYTSVHSNSVENKHISNAFKFQIGGFKNLNFVISFFIPIWKKLSIFETSHHHHAYMYSKLAIVFRLVLWTHHTRSSYTWRKLSTKVVISLAYIAP